MKLASRKNREGDQIMFSSLHPSWIVHPWNLVQVGFE